MVVSIFVGVFLAVIYGFCVQRWAIRPSKEGAVSSQGSMLVIAFLRLLSISLLFFFLSRVAALDIAVVMLVFIVGVSFSLFFLARKAMPSRVKASSLGSFVKGGKNG